MDGGIYQCKPFYRRFQEKVWGYARGNITITMYLGNRLLRWLVIFFYFIINYAGKQNQFVLYYIMRTCFFTHHMHLFAIVNWVACSSLMGYLVHRYIVSISVRQRTRAAVLAVCLFSLLSSLRITAGILKISPCMGRTPIPPHGNWHR